MGPFNLVEGQGFLSFIKVVAPNYEIPSRITIKKNVEAVYNTCKKVVNVQILIHLELN